MGGQQARIRVSRLGFGPIGWNLGHQSGTWANGIGFRPTD